MPLIFHLIHVGQLSTSGNKGCSTGLYIQVRNSVMLI